MSGVITAAPRVGEQRDPQEYGPITRTNFVRYQGASGDFHPLHHDESFAKKAGFPSVFSVGMFQAGVVASYATDWLGPENIRRFRVRFLEQCWPGDVLTCEGVVTDVDAGNGRATVTVELTCRRQSGAPAIEGEAVFEMSDE